MSEDSYIELVGLVAAAVGFFFVWWRLRHLETFKSDLASQNKLAEELRHLRAEAHGEIWTLTGALNLFGPSSEIDLTGISSMMANWYFKSGEALGTDVRDHYFILQEAMGLCVSNGVAPVRPSNDRILGDMADTENSAVERLDEMRKVAFGPAAREVFETRGQPDAHRLRDLLNVWRANPGTNDASQGGQFSAEERAWLLLQWLMSLLRSRLRAKLDGN